MQLRHDSRTIVENAVAGLKQLVGGEGASFTARVLDGEAHYTRVVATGPLAEPFGEWDGEPMVRGAVHQSKHRGWSVTSPDSVHRNRFALLDDDSDLEWARQQPVWRAFYAPNGIEDQVRAMFYGDDGTFLGYVALFRGERRAFTRDEQRTLNGLAGDIRDCLRAAWAADNIESVALHLITDEWGDIVYASKTASAWLTARRRDIIRRLRDRGSFIVDAVRFDVLQMSDPRWFCLAGNPVPGLEVAAADLSKTQRSIADAAERGFSNAEIGRMLGISESAVKYHLRIVFEELGIDSRIELVGAEGGVRRTGAEGGGMPRDLS